MQNGDVYSSVDPNFTPSGTVSVTYKFNSSASSQKLGTLSGTIGSTLTGSLGVSNKHSGVEKT